MHASGTASNGLVGHRHADGGNRRRPKLGVIPGALALLVAVTVPQLPADAAPPERVITSGNNAFFRSDRVEVGARPNGSFGTDENAPDSTWHPRDNDNNGTRIGFRYLRSGSWASGVTDGDFFLPGSPYEAWGIEVIGGSAGFLANTDSSTGLAGTFTAGTGANPTEVVWTAGTAVDGINVEKRYSVPTNGQPRLRMDAVFTNTTASALDVLYFRGVDADNCVEPELEDPTGPCAGVDYTTTNRIFEQRYAGGSRSAVVSSAEDGSVLVLWTEHTDSVAYFDSNFCAQFIVPSAILAEARAGRFSTVDAPFNDGSCGPIVTAVGQQDRNDSTIGLISQVTVPQSGSVTLTSYYELSGAAFGIGVTAAPEPNIPSYVLGSDGLPSEPVGTGVWQQIDGERVTLTPSNAGPNAVRYEVDGLRLTLTGGAGTNAARGLVADANGEVFCEICAFLATGNVIEVWMFSEPRLVAAWRIEELPCQRFSIPVGAPLDGGDPVTAGAHTLQLALPTAFGMQAVNVGVTVGRPVPTTIPAGESGLPEGMLAGSVAMAILALTTMRRFRTRPLQREQSNA